ncbi:MAG: thiol reductant ABC exporter subunit CydD [Ignavibacterium sp.]
MFDKNLLNYLNKNKTLFICSILGGLISSIFIILQAWNLSLIIDSVFLKKLLLNQVTNYIFLFILFSIGRFIFQLLSKNFALEFSSKIKKSIREKLIEKILQLGPINLSKEKSGEISNTIITGVDKLDAYFSQYLIQVILAAFVPIIILIIILPLDFLTALILFLTAPLIPFFMYLIGSISEKLNQKQWKTLSKMSAHFLEVLQGLFTLKIFNRAKEQIKIIDEIGDSFRKTSFNVLRIAFLSALTLELLSTISIAIVAVAIGLRLMNGNFQFQNALFILILAPEFYMPLRLLGARYHAGQEGLEASKRIFEILSEDVIVNNSYKKIIDLNIIKSYSIRFDSVYFKYNSNDFFELKNINIEFEAGKKTALIGPSGSGKSSIINLLLRFIEPQKGKIIIGKDDIGSFNLWESIPSEKDWRNQISWISQNPYLFHKSIEENIKLGKPDSSLDEIYEAAYKANLLDFIESLPEKFSTNIGEKGERLSGGEAQRIAIARAFLKNSPIIILDEPTSNLDPEIELSIFNSINQLTKNKTTIIIAHRLNTILNSDKIILMNNGIISSFGKHNDLLQQSEIYRNLISNYFVNTI